MKNRFPAIVVIASIAAGPAGTWAADAPPPDRDLRLPPDLTEILRAEMREIASGVQGVTLSLATADWKAIQDTSARIRASYIMEKQLTAAQARELEKALPEQFRLLDAEFHQRAGQLGAAAAAQDAELAVFHFSRLLESCSLCHSRYATGRFPGFAPVTPPGHRH